MNKEEFEARLGLLEFHRRVMVSGCRWHWLSPHSWRLVVVIKPRVGGGYTIALSNDDVLRCVLPYLENAVHNRPGTTFERALPTRTFDEAWEHVVSLISHAQETTNG